MNYKVGVGARLEDDPVQQVLGFNTAFNRCDTSRLR